MRLPAVTLACAVTLVLAVGLAGCASSPQATFYTLTAAAAPASAQAKPPYTIALNAVSLPQALDRPQIVTRAGGNQLVIDDFARWAGPLKDEIARVIADNLTRALNGADVFTYPQSAMIEADYTLLVNVQRFDATLGDAASLEVLWRLRPAKGEARFGHSTVREPAQGAGYAALVAAQSRALAAVSRDIAEAIRAAAPADK